MGTRADFYIKKNDILEWLGSIAWDGMPDSIPEKILKTRVEDNFKQYVKDFLESRDDGTLPEDGWPWPWDNSGTTDYAYMFSSANVYYSIGYPEDYWWNQADGVEPGEDDDDYNDKLKDLQKCVFPDMSGVKNVTLGGRSGLMVFQM